MAPEELVETWEGVCDWVLGRRIGLWDDVFEAVVLDVSFLCPHIMHICPHTSAVLWFGSAMYCELPLLCRFTCSWAADWSTLCACCMLFLFSRGLLTIRVPADVVQHAKLLIGGMFKRIVDDFEAPLQACLNEAKSTLPVNFLSFLG